MSLPSDGHAQLRDRIKVTNIRFGLPAGSFTSGNMTARRGIFKQGQWAPVYFDLECSREIEEELVAVVETKDSDDIDTSTTIEIGSIAKDEVRTAVEFGRFAYLKASVSYPEVTVSIKGARTGRSYATGSSRQLGGMEAIQGPALVVLSVGSNLNSIRFPKPDVAAGDPSVSGNQLRGGWVATAHLSEPGLLPDHWIGYSAADLVCLCTSDTKFWDIFVQPQFQKRRAALVEWVRRGGKLVVSTGQNPAGIEAAREIKEMLPALVQPAGKRNLDSVSMLWTDASIRHTSRAFDLRGAGSYAVLERRADRPARNLVTTRDGKDIYAVDGAYGMGHVTVLAFDLDRSPFAESERRDVAYENLFNSAANRLPATNEKFPSFSHVSGYDDYQNSLQGSLDFFEGVPVVSFGWVALFILIYIILIGPVDYLFLKKVVRRLEWTWVTFPLMVIAVSAAAYFAAYALKGRDLKINKVDIVDVDLQLKRVEGHTWFTLFSPRREDYTVSVDGSPIWTKSSTAESMNGTVVSWQGRSRNYSSNSGGVFRKTYAFRNGIDPTDPNRDLVACGITDVPVQIWSTKSFSAQWSGLIDPAKPLIEADLSLAGGGDVLIGSITNRLPIDEFSDRAIFWRGRVHDLSDLPTNVAKQVNISFSTAEESSKWLRDGKRLEGIRAQANVTTRSRGYDPDFTGTTSDPNFRLWPVLFQDAYESSTCARVPNYSLRRLDQSWRVAPDQTETAVLVLRIPTRESATEDMTATAASGSRLWLGGLPIDGGERKPIAGTLKQETYVRFMIPVKPAKK